MTRILVADDNEFVLRVVCERLRLLGHDVIGTPNGRKAWAGLQAGEFDLVLTDVEMPELDGLALLDRVSAAKPGLKVLVMSATPSYRDGALRRGAAGFLDKPFSLDQLAALVDGTARLDRAAGPDLAPQALRFQPRNGGGLHKSGA